MFRRSQEKSRLYHTKLIEERVADAIQKAAANLQEQEIDQPSCGAYGMINNIIYGVECEYDCT